MSRRLMFLAGGGASFVLPPTEVELTDFGDGGWNSQSDYKAAHYNGKTYFGWVATDGDVMIAAYDHATETVGTPFTLHAAFEDDLHVSPSILVRDSDKRIMVWYTRHNGTGLFMRISTNPEDVSSFAAEVNLDSSVTGAQYTYPSVFQLVDRLNDPIVVMYRERPGGGSGTALAYTASSNGGTTWTTQTILNTSSLMRYWKVYGRGNRIDVAMISGHPVTNAPTTIRHMWADNVNWHETDGTIITSFPIDFADMTEVYDGADGSAWLQGISLDADDHPVILYKKGPYGQGDGDIMYAHWDGSAWDNTLVSNMGGTSAVEYAPGGAVLDDTNPTIVYACLYNEDVWDLYKFVTEDDGATFERTQITRNSFHDNLWPATIRDRADGLSALWLRGTAEGDLEAGAVYNLQVMGTSR